eukprot:s1842_g1.t1
MGEVSFRQLLYNVKSLNQNLVLGGCKPIRAAGRQGHMRMEAALESVMKTLRISDDRTKYTTWLACLTSDQKVAIVESEDTKNWINMSMPYPFWTANDPFVWCAEEHQESCFEEIRQSLGWDVVPVVRNRQRALFFGESPFDNFGPALYDALRPGQDPTPGEAEGLMNLFARNDDLGSENAANGLDEATRKYLRSKCDKTSQICE